MTPLHQQFADLFYPLADFYTQQAGELPSIERVEGGALPQPYRRLLVHNRDMTSTLESFAGSKLHLRVLEKRSDDGALTRQVVLMTDDDEQPMEFGAIRIQLGRFEPAAREEIVQCVRPLGAILEHHSVRYACHPSAFFSVTSDAIARRAFGLTEPRKLFGRHNTLVNHLGDPLAEVVEILPPLEHRTAKDA